MPFELLCRDVNSINFSSFDKEYIKSRLRDFVYLSFKQVSKIYVKNLPDEEIQALKKNLIENWILVIKNADKGNTILNKIFLAKMIIFRGLIKF